MEDQPVDIRQFRESRAVAVIVGALEDVPPDKRDDVVSAALLISKSGNKTLARVRRKFNGGFPPAA